MKTTANTQPSTGPDAGEISVLVYTAGQYRLGINLSKVREITRLLPVKAVPYSHPMIRGVFELREHLVPALDLREWLQVEDPAAANPKIIIAEFLGLRIGFLVDGVEGIQRLPWSRIHPPDRIKRFSSDILGTINREDGLINLLDYERIVLTINPEVILPARAVEKSSKRLAQLRRSRNVWIVEDSRTVRDFLKDHLMRHGYTGIMFFENGRHALDTLEVIHKKRKPAAGGEGGQEQEREGADVIITDIEMPVMDGYQFIKTIKSDPRTMHIPVILFSALLSAGNKLKGELVNADAQLSKNEGGNLVHLLDRFFFKEEFGLQLSGSTGGTR